jgi:transcription initiation factor TFIID TATA-box-binding protein
MAKADKGFSATHRRGIVLKPTYRVVNIVASADLQMDLDLYGLAKMSHDIDYEPEQFPGAIFKLQEPKAALLLFKNGKMICTGCATEKDVRKSVGEAIELIKRFKASIKQKAS